jgi:hypothetical protein
MIGAMACSAVLYQTVMCGIQRAESPSELWLPVTARVAACTASWTLASARLGLTASMMASGWYRMPPTVAVMAEVRQFHSAYIPGLATSDGFLWHTTAQPFNWSRNVSAGQARFGLVRLAPPAGLHADRPERGMRAMAGQLVIEGQFEIAGRRSERR